MDESKYQSTNFSPREPIFDELKLDVFETLALEKKERIDDRSAFKKI